MWRVDKLIWIGLALWPCRGAAQTASEFAHVLERLERLERENRALAEEVRALRAEVVERRAPAPAPEPAGIPERLEITERRVEEQAQTKVESAQKFPIRLTGMALFNAYSNSRDNNDSDYPGIASANPYRRAGGTFRQSIIGLDYRGPETAWGGRVGGSLYLDFFGPPGNSLSETARLRTASVHVDWKTRSLMAGLDKPIFNPRDPSSLARVGVSPLTGAGNLWLWLPQVRFEQTLRWSESGGLRAQAGLVQTRESAPYNDSAAIAETERSRPGWEGRLEWFHRIDDDRRVEIASGFHVSRTHVGRFSVPSDLFSFDWLIAPVRGVELTGVFYRGRNVAHLGTGGLRQGYFYTSDEAYPVHSFGGWGQMTLHAGQRVAFHFFSGQMDDRNSDLRRGALGKNLVYGGNVYYYLAPNVIAAFEATQTRSLYVGNGLRHNNHYDLALAYLF